jgi:hypothetical protein
MYGLNFIFAWKIRKSNVYLYFIRFVLIYAPDGYY